nr:ethylene-responsive transcription factor 15-like [Ipomoea batatas]
MYQETMSDDIYLFLVERLLADSDVSEMLSAVTPSCTGPAGAESEGLRIGGGWGKFAPVVGIFTFFTVAGK